MAWAGTRVGAWVSQAVGRDLAVDLGTANTLVWARGEGIVVDEPSVVAVRRGGTVVAVGAEAKEMVGRTPEGISVVRPLRGGVVDDVDVTERMLRHFIQAVHPTRHLARPRLVVCVPCQTSPLEQRAVVEAGERAGARRVYMLEEPMAAAIGAGLPVHRPTGTMVVDLGGGTTEVAVISMGGIVTSRSVPIGGDDLDDALVRWVKREYRVLLGERTAEDVKCSVGSAFPMSGLPEAEVRGRDLLSGLPRSVRLSPSEVREAIAEPLRIILAGVRAALDLAPPDLVGDVADHGIVLSGGGAQLHGLAARLQHETKIPVRLADEPRHAVIRGAGTAVEEFEKLQQVMVSGVRR
jgi:rod shape-determining protein MreB